LPASFFLCSARLGYRAERIAADQMKMEMVNFLARMAARVDAKPVAILA